MNTVKQGILLSKYPSWNAKMIRRVIYAVLGFLLLLFMSLGFIERDIKQKYLSFPENVLVSERYESVQFADLVDYEQFLSLKSEFLKGKIKKANIPTYYFQSTAYLTDPISPSHNAKSFVFTDFPTQYAGSVANTQIDFLDPSSTTEDVQGVFISEKIAMERYGTKDVIGEKFFFTTRNYTEDIPPIETKIINVFRTVPIAKSLLFDNSADQANSLDDIVFASLALGKEYAKIQPENTYNVYEMFCFEESITSGDYQEVIKDHPYMVCSASRIAITSQKISPLFDSLYYVLYVFCLVCFLTVAIINILRNIEIRDIIDVQKIFYIKKSKLVFMITISNVYFILKGLLFTCIGYGLINLILYLSLHYLILPALNFLIMVGIVSVLPLLLGIALSWLYMKAPLKICKY